MNKSDQKPNPSDSVDLDNIARRFHDSYERLAPEFNYSTRVESAVPWEDVPENNKQLMRAVMADALVSLIQQAIDKAVAAKLQALTWEAKTYISKEYYLKDGKPQAMATYQAIPLDVIEAELAALSPNKLKEPKE